MAAAEALGRVGPAAAAAVPALEQAVGDEDVGPRMAAIRALQQIGPAARSAVPTLRRALADPDIGARWWAEEALAVLTGPSAGQRDAPAVTIGFQVWHDGVTPPGAYRVDRRLARKIDPMTRVALEAAHALVEGRLEGVDPARVGICVANLLGGWTFGEPEMVRLHQTRDGAGVNPFLGTAWFPAAPQGEIAIAMSLLGHSKTFAGPGTAFLQALEYASELLQDSVADAMLVGATEALGGEWLLSHLGVPPRAQAGFVLLRRGVDPGPEALSLTFETPPATTVLGRADAPYPVDAARIFLGLIEECLRTGEARGLCVGTPAIDPVVCIRALAREELTC
jgi:hypothetical protein